MAETYTKKVIDMGAGDAKFAYSIARDHSDWLVYAADASTNMFGEVEEKIRRKPAKGGLRNLVLLQLAAENIPDQQAKLPSPFSQVREQAVPETQLIGEFDQVYINFPWGSLLRGIIHSEPEVIGNIAKLLKPAKTGAAGEVIKPGGVLQILLTYDPVYEPQTISELNLEVLTLPKLQQLAATWTQFGLDVQSIQELNQLDLTTLGGGSFQTTWWKKIRQRERVVWKLAATKA
jgi:16S rRNA (adenine(1408)-N(1))-methyltransferase